MQNELDESMKSIDQATLTPLIRQVLHNETMQVTEWQYQRLQGGAGGGVYRVRGKGRDHHQTVPWSLILKIPRQTVGLGDPYGGRREPVVYRSGFLKELPGTLAAPQCFGVVEQPDGGHWIWLEDITEEANGPWSLERYATAARGLGQFNGAFLVGHPLPAWPWLGASSQLRDYVDRFIPPLDQLRASLADWQAHHGLSLSMTERLLRLYEERELYLHALEQLPQTLCHGDADRRNLLWRATAAGQEEMVAIDWALVGLGVPGEELHRLLNNAILFSQVDPVALPSLEQIVFTSYLSGLEDMGWQADPRVVRLGYAASSALAEGLVLIGVLLIRLLDEQWWQPLYQQFLGGSSEAIMARTALLLSYHLGLADEARALLDTLP